MSFMDEVKQLSNPDSEIHEKKTEDILSELRKLTTRVSFGYSPLRRIIVYEIYRFLLGVDEQPPVSDFFKKMEMYPYHRDRLATRFAELETILVPIPESREEVDLQLLSLDEEVFNPQEKEYKGAVYTEIDARSYPMIVENQGYGVDYTITTAQGQKIEIDSKIALIDSHKGDEKRLVIFALPGEKRDDFRAVFAVWKDFYKMLSPLKEPEDIFLAIYEYYHFSAPAVQSFIDDYSLIKEFALELSYVASVIVKGRSFLLSKESITKNMRGRWLAFHGAQMLVDDLFYYISAWLGYLRPTKTVSDDTRQSLEGELDWETFSMKCELRILNDRSKQYNVSIDQLQNN